MEISKWERILFVKKSRIEGLGLFTRIFIPKWTPICEIDDSFVVDSNSPLPGGASEEHCDYFDNRVVLLQDPIKYINHSCLPNTIDKSIGNKRIVIAIKDISMGEEITCDYSINGTNNILPGYYLEPWECKCGADVCRRVIYDDFFELPIPTQVEYLVYLDDWFVRLNVEKLQGVVKEYLLIK